MYTVYFQNRKNISNRKIRNKFQKYHVVISESEIGRQKEKSNF